MCCTPCESHWLEGKVLQRGSCHSLVGREGLYRVPTVTLDGQSLSGRTCRFILGQKAKSLHFVQLTTEIVLWIWEDRLKKEKKKI